MTEFTAEFSTLPFKISRSVMLQTALWTWHARLVWILIALVVAAGIVCSILIDWRCGLVSMMFLLVCAPAILAMLYYNYALSPRCITEVFPHTLTFLKEGIKIRAIVPPLKNADEETDTAVALPKSIGHEIRYEEIARIHRSADAIVLILKGTPPGLIHIPYQQIEDLQTLNRLLREITE